MPGKNNITALLFVVSAVAAVALSFGTANNTAPVHDKVKDDSAVSKKAFLAAYSVLMHPRCMNCHPTGDAPLQGDDSHVHTMGVKRGHDGKGMYALKCSNCHQAENTPGLHQPPGNPNWHLPPEDMKMVFQGKSPRELAATLLDPKLNGGKSKEQLIEHVTFDKLVVGCWNPGEGRTLPPLPHDEFAKQVKLWIETGAYLPDK
jgi:cytochrome c5